jgi:hypothetical protein
MLWQATQVRLTPANLLTSYVVGPSCPEFGVVAYCPRCWQ